MNEKKNTFNKICGRLCVELTGVLSSPLSVGSGEQEESDADVILNACGVPFIPGSAIAGALRSYNRDLGLKMESDQLFGTPEDESPGAKRDRQSRIFCYDIPIKDAVTGIRDGVKLGDNKTPVKGSKYEIQIIESGAAFRMRIEIIEREDCLKGRNNIQEVWEADKYWIRRWMKGFSAGEIRLGARSTRGFGKLEINTARVREFNMEQKEEYLEWLDWDWDNEDAFEKAELIEEAESDEHMLAEHLLEVPLCIPYTLLVRTYSKAFRKGDGLPDYGQLTVQGKGEQAVIPGSSFAGAFRSHIARIVKDLASLKDWEAAQKKLEPFFGTWLEEEKRDEKLRSSRVIFEESVVDGGSGLPLVRNAIDRFTGGTVNGALFEEIPWAGGTVLLRIRWKKEDITADIETDVNSQVICGMLLWAIMDVQAGILPIGGETAVGRGIFCKPVNQEQKILLDGKTLDTAQGNKYMQAAVQWCKGAEDESAGN